MNNENFILIKNIEKENEIKLGKIQSCCGLYLKYCRCSKEVKK